MHKSGVTTLWTKVKIAHSVSETTIWHELYGLTFYDADIDKLNIPIDKNGDRELFTFFSCSLSLLSRQKRSVAISPVCRPHAKTATPPQIIGNELDGTLSKYGSFVCFIFCFWFVCANSWSRLTALTYFWTFLRQHRQAANIVIDVTLNINEIIIASSFSILLTSRWRSLNHR